MRKCASTVTMSILYRENQVNPTNHFSEGWTNIQKKWLLFRYNMEKLNPRELLGKNLGVNINLEKVVLEVSF